MLSLFQNWLGPMPQAISVCPSLAATVRASDQIAVAGAQVTLLACSGVMLVSRYSFVRSKTGACFDLLAVGERDLEAAFERRVDARELYELIAHRVARYGGGCFLGGIPHHKIGELARQHLRHLHAVLLDRRRGVVILAHDVDPVRKRLVHVAGKTSLALSRSSVSMRTSAGRSVKRFTKSAL